MSQCTSTWLLPRLAALRRRRPDIEVQIETSTELADLLGGVFDALRALRGALLDCADLPDTAGSSFVSGLKQSHRDAVQTEPAMRNAMLAMLTSLSLIILATVPTVAADYDANKRLIRDYIETVIKRGHLDAMVNYFAADYAEHNPRLPPGVAGKKQFIGSLMTGFSDYHGEIQEMIAEGDKVVTRTRWTGTQDGTFLGRPASGNKIDFATADFYRIENGKIVEHWDVVDSLARAVALGLVPPPK